MAFKFSIETSEIVKFSRRILTLIRKHKDLSTIQFYIYKSKVNVVFNSSLDGAASFVVFDFKFNKATVLTEGTGVFAVKDLVDVLQTIPCSSTPGKPTSRIVTFEATDNQLKISTDIEIQHDQFSKTSKVAVSIKTLKHYPEYSVNVTEFKNLLSVSTIDLKKGIDLCTFLKSDLISKGENGFLFVKDGEKLTLLATDSGTASKFSMSYSGDVKQFKALLSADVTNIVKGFIDGVDTVNIGVSRRRLFLSAGDGRKMIAPLIGQETLPLTVDLFYPPIRELGVVDLETLSSFLRILNSCSADQWKRTTLNFNGSLTLTAGEDEIKDIPVNISNAGQFDINGEFLYRVLSKLVKVADQGSISVDTAVGEHIVVASPDDGLRFIIQGLS